jgi:hypothetical protein
MSGEKLTGLFSDGRGLISKPIFRALANAKNDGALSS